MKQRLKCILLIDDDEATNFINKMIIENLDIAEHVQVAWNGKEALEYLTNTGMFENENENARYPQPDLIFLDINMPVMDGWEFMNEYHKLDENKKGNKMIVMLTTSINPDDEIKASLISEITDFKSKPIFSEGLEELVKKYFPKNFL